MAIILALFLLFGQEESAIARRASIYPHPKPPAHLVKYTLDMQILVEHKHFFWFTSFEPYRGHVRIEQARPNGGWWIAAEKVAVEGKLDDTIEIDSTWPQHVLLALDGGIFVETDLSKGLVIKIKGD